MAYINNLSDDILSSIFSHSMTSTAILPPSLGDDPRLQLMAVSPRWRRVILQASIFWDILIILPRNPEATHGLLMIAKEWLSRIHSMTDHILSLFLLQPRYLNRQEPIHRTRNGEGYRVLEDGILPAARGTKWFSCTLSTVHGINSFFDIPLDEFNCVEGLDISFPRLPDPELAHTTVTMIKAKLSSFTTFQSSHHLRSAPINIGNGIHPLRLRIPWWRLSKIDMTNTTLRPNTFLEVLSASAPSLKDGSFAIRFKRVTRSTASAPNETTPIVKACFLQYLHLRLINPSRDRRFLSRLYLTSLSHLKIDLDDRVGWRMSIYDHLLSRSSQTLRTLELVDAPSEGRQSNNAMVCQDTDLDKLFSMCPNVEHLRLPIGVQIPQNTLNKITECSLLPCLRSLEVFSTIGIDVLEMVGRRNELVYHRAGIGSSNLGTGIGGYPPFLGRVVLHTLLENQRNITLAKRYIRSFSSSQGTVFDIKYLD
ncbi:hypothetical protein M413DRAFT_32433 [Hebeloma cylindrosporum]|uniref:F-box domain-containing protein n=1 Tax=Hebeloma cylindrosporum TaxID=76867 RepID=A0A0C2XCC0_HEBCY|nr:hypothetical protein M413DRAFT_32433 [Hebeloma cylindrosporum h7]